jgi:hypothetical protein
MGSLTILLRVVGIDFIGHRRRSDVGQVIVKPVAAIVASTVTATATAVPVVATMIATCWL